MQAFLLSLFSAVDPGQAKGEELTARELLRRGEQRIETELAGEPETQARLWSEIAAVHLQLGEPRSALPLARRAVDALISGSARPRRRCTRARYLLGNALLESGRIEEAEAEYRAALAVEAAAGARARRRPPSSTAASPAPAGSSGTPRAPSASTASRSRRGRGSGRCARRRRATPSTT